MNYKLQGEAALRAAYDAANNDKLGYVIIRPGGLMDGEKVGPGSIELNQGTSLSTLLLIIIIIIIIIINQR